MPIRRLLFSANAQYSDIAESTDQSKKIAKNALFVAKCSELFAHSQNLYKICEEHFNRVSILFTDYKKLNITTNIEVYQEKFDMIVEGFNRAKKLNIKILSEKATIDDGDFSDDEELHDLYIDTLIKRDLLAEMERIQAFISPIARKLIYNLSHHIAAAAASVKKDSDSASSPSPQGVDEIDAELRKRARMTN